MAGNNSVDNFLDSILPFDNLTDPEKEKYRNYIKAVSSKCFVNALVHPIQLAKTLCQFGYEPYPISSGRAFWFFGRYAYYLPNIFIYLKNTYREVGIKALYTGVDSSLLGSISNVLVTFSFTMYIDRHFPDLGGELLVPINQPAELDQYDKFRDVCRKAIRETFSVTVATMITRPFMTIMCRQIAQMIGNEAKFSNVIQSLFIIGRDEGPEGLFSGLIPQLIFEWSTIWSIALLNYGFDWMMGADNEVNNDIASRANRESKNAGKILLPVLASSFVYPFSLVSSVMSIAGSGLLASLMPYSSSYANWHDAYSSLYTQNALDRGRSLFWRSYKGAIKVDRVTGKIFASTSFNFH